MLSQVSLGIWDLLEPKGSIMGWGPCAWESEAEAEPTWYLLGKA